MLMTILLSATVNPWASLLGVGVVFGVSYLIHKINERNNK